MNFYSGIGCKNEGRKIETLITRIERECWGAYNIFVGRETIFILGFWNLPNKIL